MAEIDRLPIAPHIDNEAAAWVARRDSGRLDESAAAEFAAWLEASPAHRSAFEQYAKLWGDFDSLSSRPQQTAAPAPANDLDGFYVGRRAVAAGIVVMVLSAATFAGFTFLGSSASHAYATAVGEQRTVTLADSSRVTLNTDTRFIVKFSEGQRRILLERGEALFEVAHDPARPFTVISPAGSVRAVGTRFVVRVGEDRQLDVIVTQGRVIVSPNADGDIGWPSAAPASAGQQVHVVEDRLAIASVSSDQLNRELAWRQGDIVFSGEPLSQAAAEMQRYTQTRISVDPAVAHHSVGGYFRTNDVAAFIETVESVFPVRAVRSKGEVRFVARRS